MWSVLLWRTAFFAFLGISYNASINNDEQTSSSNNELDRDSRIVGGRVVEEGEWPFLVFVGTRRPGHRELDHRCGGAILRPSFILTAAHCVSSVKGTLAVLAGYSQLPEDGDAGWDDAVDVISFIKHPAYEHTNKTSDVAVLKLARPLVENGVNISRIGLNNDSSCPKIQQQCRVAGWGLTAVEGAVSQTALVVTVTTVSTEACNETYGDISSDKLCAGEKEGQKDACFGDSGGPLVGTCHEETLVVGVVSYGDGCALPGKPGVYSRVSSNWEWIQAHLNATQASTTVEPTH